jgi:4-amino-4-deoxychorismate lyase
MKFFVQTSTLYYPWDQVTLAHWRKYPNPWSAHVLASDVLSRHIDAIGRLCSLRLFLKTGTLPRWGRHFIATPNTYIIEESTVDTMQRKMTTVTRNITHARLMTVEETQYIEVHPENSQWTKCTIEARIVSNIGLGLKSRLEKFGLKRFRESAIMVSRPKVWLYTYVQQQKILTTLSTVFF